MHFKFDDTNRIKGPKSAIPSKLEMLHPSLLTDKSRITMEYFMEIDKLRGDVNIFDLIYLSSVEIPEITGIYQATA